MSEFWTNVILDLILSAFWYWRGYTKGKLAARQEKGGDDADQRRA